MLLEIQREGRVIRRAWCYIMNKAGDSPREGDVRTLERNSVVLRWTMKNLILVDSYLMNFVTDYMMADFKNRLPKGMLNLDVCI